MCSFLLYLFFFFFLYLIFKVNQTEQEVIGQPGLPHLAPSHTGREEAPLPAHLAPQPPPSGWPPHPPPVQAVHSTLPRACSTHCSA